ncbi:MAG: hypothetical protein LBO69_03895 [Ignavibacteria bacterium]|jgi:hypothetical protein|nr:hypothetical protein [Ignavibacteria bacterium]
MYEQLTELVNKISYCTEKVANTIKEISSSADNDIISRHLDTLNGIYTERNNYVEELSKFIKDGYDELLDTIPEWQKYIADVAPIEDANIAFLNQQTEDSKHKLRELANNRSLMIYNKKVKLSYENKLL